jgi:prophage regulatory protein
VHTVGVVHQLIERHFMSNNTESLTASLPTTGYIRQAQLIPAIIPVSSATWWRWCKSGKAPKPVKLSEKVTAWRAEAIRAFIDELATASAK